MFFVFVAEQNVVIFFIKETVERLFVDEDLLRRRGTDLLFDYEMMAVFAVVGEEEILLALVAENGIAYLLVVEAIGEVESYSVVVHVFQQGEHKPVGADL